MIKTMDELKAQAHAKGIEFYPVHNCSMCGYRCGYIIKGDEVAYDAGCDCSYQYPETRDWADLTRCYNLNQPENNPNIKDSFLQQLNNTWQFDDPVITAASPDHKPNNTSKNARSTP